MSQKKIIFIGLVSVILLISALYITFFSTQKTDEKAGQKMTAEIKPYDLALLFSGLKNKCGNSVPCFLEELNIITAKYGPQASLGTLDNLKTENLIPPSTDDHQIAHEIGRQTAKNFGINQEAFLLCPISAYNGGCQHGYFEYVLGKTESQTEAANLICNSLDESFSSKFIFYCYHGVGHGVMMAQAYDLQGSLDVCDSLSQREHIEGCWQGVFMENTNSAIRGEAREGVFSFQEPLAPCNKIDEKYRHQCFINHSGWLMRVFSNDFSKASHACLEAPPGYINSCLQSLGLMTTNPTWQQAIIPGPANRNLQALAWEICKQFPQSHLDQCIIGGVDNIMNFNELNVSEADSFCELAGTQYENLCYSKIGTNLKFQSPDNSKVKGLCDTLENPKNEICKRGAGF